MGNAVITWFLSNAPEMGIIIIIIVATAYISWRLSRYYSKMEDVRNKVNDLPCEAMKQEIKEIKNLSEVVQSINDMLLEIRKCIIRMDNSTIDVLVKKFSPLKMTAIGEILFQKSYAKDVINDNLDFFIQEIEKTHPQTAYDVENESLNVLFVNQNKEIFNKIKQYIYYEKEYLTIEDPDTHEKVEIKLSLMNIIKLMGIYLRDCYLARHPDIK